jgi:predicted ATPase
VREEGINRYDFSHDRIRDVAYVASSPIQRRILHRRVAEALEHHHAGELNGVSGELARHYGRAGQTDCAIAWHERAANAAWILQTLSESIEHCRSGLTLLRSLPSSDERKARELRLLVTLSHSTNAATGLTAAEFEETLLRARELAAELNDIDNRFDMTVRLISVAIASGRTAQAGVIVREALALAGETQNPEHRVRVLVQDGRLAQHLGNFEHAGAVLEQALSLSSNVVSQNSSHKMPRQYRQPPTMQGIPVSGQASTILATAMQARRSGKPSPLLSSHALRR